MTERNYMVESRDKRGRWGVEATPGLTIEDAEQRARKLAAMRHVTEAQVVNVIVRPREIVMRFRHVDVDGCLPGCNASCATDHSYSVKVD